ncbi:MAG TPA: protein translocase subunit SecF [Polyangiaceae bacterium]|jgi:preprotein translocase subunit SecF
MHLFKSGKVYDFMAVRWYFIGLSLFLTVGAALLLIAGKARLGTDFTGGTEVEIGFKKPLTPGDLRAAVTHAGFSEPGVIKVDDPSNPNRYLIRLEEVSTISAAKQAEVENSLCVNVTEGSTTCPPERQATEVKFSPGGDKISVRFRNTPDLAWVKNAISNVKGVVLRPGQHNPTVQNSRDNKVEIQLMSKGDQLMAGLKQALGSDVVPDAALRTEWIGPRAGAQLRDSAIKSIAISIVFIMVYIAFRFDLRFAPGGIVALTHDALGTIGILIVLGKEINLTTIAAALTVVGYSVNDTVIVYDRVRENMGKLRGTSFFQLINISTSEMLGRTLLTSSTVVISLLAFFIWGTGELKDFSLALIIGVVLGTYSSIYVALPLTEWLDHRLFSRVGSAVKKKPTVSGRNAVASG